MAMLDDTKLALRLSTDVFDDELTDLITAAQTDLGLGGVDTIDTDDALTKRAIITYCKMHFGEPDDYDRLKASYDEQKAQMSVSSSYTTYDDDDDEDE